MESCTIQLTPSAQKHGNLNIRPCGKDFFPPDVFGGPTKDQKGREITIIAEGLSEPVKTDIPKEKSGRIRWLFRQREWVKGFVLYHKLHTSDTVTIERVAQRTYKVSPNNHASQVVIEKERSAKHQKPLSDSHFTGKAQKKLLDIGHNRTCDCPKNHINCLPAKEWLKCQLGVWQFTYEGRDIRDKKLHPATFPISLAHKGIKLFCYERIVKWTTNLIMR